QRPFAYCI
ncbi:hypothetical protein ABKN59_012013, partial [Abortiporus biennis]